MILKLIVVYMVAIGIEHTVDVIIIAVTTQINNVSRFTMKKNVVSNFAIDLCKLYFRCYRCQVTKNALKLFVVNDMGTIEWHEFCGCIDGTLNQYRDLILLTNATVSNNNEMKKVLLPAMRDRATIGLILYQIQRCSNNGLSGQWL